MPVSPASLPVTGPRDAGMDADGLARLDASSQADLAIASVRD